MRVLLFSMPDVIPHIAKRQWEAPNLGLSSIAANLDPRHGVFIADLVVRQWSVPSSVRRCLQKYKPDVVGLSAMIFQYYTARKIARLIRKERPGTLVVLGGYHATTMYRELADSPEAEVLDFIFHGEADHSFNELMDALEGRRSIESVRGLSYKQDGAFHHNPPRHLEDVSQIALPDRDRRVYGGYHFYFDKTDVMETSRGCLLRCNFCSMNQMYGTSFRTYSIERVLLDIEGMYRRGVRHILIVDDNITLDVPRLAELSDAIAARKKPGLQFIIQASSAGIAKDPSLPRRLADAGVTQVFLGIENGSEENLRQMKKGKIVGVTQTAVRRLIDSGIIVAGGMITGMPDDDAASVRGNYQFFAEMGIHNVLDQIMTPYPNTEIRQELITDGLVTNAYDYQWYNGYWPQVRTRHLSSKELLFTRWKSKRDVIGVWKADGEFQRNFPRWSWFWNNVLRNVILLNERRMLWMYGEKGRFRRQMLQWARLNDYFGDIVIDERFFDPDSHGPEGLGDPAAERDYGAHPRMDTSVEPAFVSTRDFRWSARAAESPPAGRSSRSDTELSRTTPIPESNY